jgi:hypothetical protein
MIGMNAWIITRPPHYLTFVSFDKLVALRIREDPMDLESAISPIEEL